MDVGCGAGIFSFCFLCKNLFQKNSISVNQNELSDSLSESLSDLNNQYFKSIENIDINLYLSDIDEECVYSTFINFINYKKFFTEKVYKLEGKEKFYKFNLSLIDISKGDLVKNFAFNEKYYGFFDIILANLPQTPSEESIRSKF